MSFRPPLKCAFATMHSKLLTTTELHTGPIFEALYSKHEMTETMHAFVNERLRLALSGHIPGHQLDTLVGNVLQFLCRPITYQTKNAPASLSHLFKTVRPDLTPAKVLIAVSEPSVCGSQYCSCHSADSILHTYKITVFVDRKEQGRRVTKPWVRASSAVGFGECVEGLLREIEQVEETKRAVDEEAERKKGEEEAEAEREKKATEAKRFERGGRSGLMEEFEKLKGRERGFTVPRRGLSGGNL